MTPRPHLVIFARWPAAGAGKRRLATGVGAIEALRFQRVRLGLLVLRLARDRRWRTWIAVAPNGPQAWPAGPARIAQGRGNLGERMGRVLGALPRGPAVIVGTDIPGITPGHVAAALRALGSLDAVFGPTPDGGYWLVGARRQPGSPLSFAAVRWSSEHALADTLANLRGRRVALVDDLADVDDAAALKAAPHWGRLCPPPAMPRTGRR